MSGQNNNNGSSRNKVPLDVHIETLLHESSQPMQESPGLKLEWEHYLRLETIISKIREREVQRDSTDLNDNTNKNGLISADKENKGEDDKVKEGEEDWDNERRRDAFPAFMEWLKAQGVNSDKVEISWKDAVEGFGLKTKVPLKEGAEVFTIPQKVIITSTVAKTSKLNILVEKDPLLGGMQNVLLAVFLIYERFVNPNSEWKQYIDILPRTFNTVVYFTKEEMTVLKHSPSAFREALRMLRNVARQYAYFHARFRKGTDSASRALKQIFTYNRYIWGVSAVTTRINHLPNPNGEPILSLIPLWDLCNHEESEVICTDYNEETQTLICYAGHEYEQNSEFTIFYGRRSSIDFLVHNGFVPRSYQHDAYALELGVGMNDQNYNRKKAILVKLGLECQNSFSVRPDNLSTANKLFAFIRVFLANETVISEMEERQDDLKYLLEPDEAYWKFLATRFALLKRAAENSLASAMKTLYGEKEKDTEPSAPIPTSLSASHPRATVVLQLIKNEQKVLEMLAHCADNEVKKSSKKETQ